MKAQDPIVQTNTVLHKIGVRAWCKFVFFFSGRVELVGQHIAAGI